MTEFIFKMMAFCRLGSLSFDFLSWLIDSEGQNASAFQTSSKSVKRFLRYCDFFSYFQNGCRLQSWILKISKFYWLMGSREPRHIIILNFGKIGQHFANIYHILHLFEFSN